MQTPKELYARRIAKGEIQSDEFQEALIDKLNELYLSLCDHHATSKSLIHNIYNFITVPASKPLKGLYIWGGVGRGKTLLVDLFFDTLPFDEKLRLHFHRFMRKVHFLLNEYKGTPDPLEKVAADFAQQARVICFDEFYVKDITDAMILGRLLDKLLHKGITLVATSNVRPQDLYKDGLQRGQFLPAIDLLLSHTEVFHINTTNDYRFRALERVEIYHVPCDENSMTIMDDSFSKLAPEPGSRGESITIEKRPIQTIRVADDVIWLDFIALCGGPRSANDYIEIAQCFHTVFVSGVPKFTAATDDMARRFIAFIDEMYDHAVKVIITAQVKADDLYHGDLLKFEFERTVSRLTEMQTSEYLGQEHRP